MSANYGNDSDAAESEGDFNPEQEVGSDNEDAPVNQRPAERKRASLDESKEEDEDDIGSDPEEAPRSAPARNGLSTADADEEDDDEEEDAAEVPGRKAAADDDDEEEEDDDEEEEDDEVRVSCAYEGTREHV